MSKRWYFAGAVACAAQMPFAFHGIVRLGEAYSIPMAIGFGLCELIVVIVGFFAVAEACR